VETGDGAKIPILFPPGAQSGRGRHRGNLTKTAVGAKSFRFRRQHIQACGTGEGSIDSCQTVDECFWEGRKRAMPAGVRLIPDQTWDNRFPKPRQYRSNRQLSIGTVSQGARDFLFQNPKPGFPRISWNATIPKQNSFRLLVTHVSSDSARPTNRKGRPATSR